MQRPEEANFVAAEVPFVGQQQLDRSASGLKDCAVARFLIRAQQRSQFTGNRERDDEVLHWKQLVALPGKPLVRLLLLTVGAMSIAAGPSEEVLSVAAFASVSDRSKLTGSTSSDQTNDLTM
jgi:hypothetical protein